MPPRAPANFHSTHEKPEAQRGKAISHVTQPVNAQFMRLQVQCSWHCTHCTSLWSKPISRLTPCWNLSVWGGTDPPSSPGSEGIIVVIVPQTASFFGLVIDRMSTFVDAVIFHSGAFKSLRDHYNSCYAVIGLLGARSFICFIFCSLGYPTSPLLQMQTLRFREDK